MTRRRHAFKHFVRYPLEALALALVMGFAKLLGLEGASFFFGTLFRVLGPRLPVNHVARNNIMRVFPNHDAGATQRLLADMWENLGRVFGEYAHLKTMMKRIQNGTIAVAGADFLDQARDGKTPIVFFSAHYGNWEITNVLSAWKQANIAGVYRAANNPYVDWLLTRLRHYNQENLAAKGARGTRELIKNVNRGHSVCMLMDQRLNEGRMVPFLGYPAMTPTALAQLAWKHKAPVVPIKIVRQRGTRFTVTFGPPLPRLETENENDFIDDTLRRINATIGAWILEQPAQWLWVHRRWDLPAVDEV